MPTTAPNDIEIVARRRDVRVPGPFDGRWVSLLTVPIRIFDLSMGGCLVQSFHEVSPGTRLTIEIELPYVGWVQVEAEALYMRGEDGFASKFTGMTDDNRALLKRAIEEMYAQTGAA